ncbi:MAG: PorP/SprF family type IX secretion system membrane protein [Fluviicola sp.]|nr:PorP/SprF family type IX secretion system membrane protein [Fluviicola sp.]MBP6271295.1 PorP/SprF family type IX secretion system membrane protein [Fluviicola sp.]
MKMFKYILLVAITSCSTTMIIGQADPSFRQNQFNSLLLNPAQAGANSYDDVSVLASRSLVGFTGAPRTITASGNFRLFQNIGFATTALVDQIGPTKTTRGSVDFSYHLKLSNTWKMSIGLRGIASSVNVDLPSLSTTQQNDPHMTAGLASGTLFDAGWGALFYSKKLYFGVAQPRVGVTRYNQYTVTDYVQNRSVLSYVGADLVLNNRMNFRPSLVVRYLKSNPLYIDVNAMFTYNKTIDFGVMYQLNSNIGVMLGLELSKKMYVGYSYSYPTTTLNRISTQGHELVLRLKFNQKSASKFQGPRFFN